MVQKRGRGRPRIEGAEEKDASSVMMHFRLSTEEKIKLEKLAEEDERTVSSWLRKLVRHELRRIEAKDEE